LTIVGCFTVLFIANTTTIHDTVETGEGSFLGGQRRLISPCSDRLMHYNGPYFKRNTFQVVGLNMIGYRNNYHHIPMSLGLSVEVQLYSFLTSALDEVEWSVFTPQLYPRGNSSTH